MTSVPTLWDLPEPRQLARRSHPETSKLAAVYIIPRLKKLNGWIVSCIESTPGLTAAELESRYCPTNGRRIGRRLDGLEKMGVIHRSGPRKCSVSHRMACTWWPRSNI